MKKQYIILALGAMLMASCADEFDRNFMVARPGSSEAYQYLNDYKALKEYVSDPNFHLGIGTNAADYASQGATYVITNVNFNETVAGNAMKMGSCVNFDSKKETLSWNFGTVSSFVTEAKNAGMNVYGHTLAWHSQQPVEWLNYLIADKAVPVDPNAPKAMAFVEKLTNGDCEGKEAVNFVIREKGQADANRIDNGVGVNGSRGIKVHSVEDAGDDWNTQFFIYTPEHIWETGMKYQFKMKARADHAANISLQAHNAPGGYIHWSMCAGGYNLTADWQEFTFEGEISAEQGSQEMHTIAFNLNCDKTDNNYYFDDMSWKAWEESDGPIIIQQSLISNGDMEGKDAQSFAKKENSGSIVYEITDGVGKNGSRGVKIASKGGQADAWESQFWIVADEEIPQDSKVHVEFDYRADAGCAGTSVDTQAHYGPGEYQHWACAGTVAFTGDWQHYTKDFTVDGSMAGAKGSMKSIAFNMSPNSADGVYYIDNVVLWVEKEISGGAGPVTYMEDLIKNGDMEGEDLSCFFTTEPSTGGPHASTIYDGVGKEGSRGIMVQSEDNPAQDWDTQFFIRLPETLSAGTPIHVEFDYRADNEGGSDTQAHNEPGAYMMWHCIGSPTFKTEWQHFSLDAQVEADNDNMRTVAFNLAKNKKKTKFYFDNIVFQVERESSSGGIPQTEAEKKDTLTYAMDQWISNMMDACKDDETGEVLVKAWDVVNEAISGGNPDGEGVYALQHGTPDNTTDFFWQDYLGDLDYVRTAVRLARQYGGDDLKLFVNDYNLESDWDQNGKLKSLIKWIERWEADGVTKIDGIGSQMHISFYEDEATQESKKKAITESFKLMAASGKLVRISELDMGYVKKGATEGTKTVDMTEEMHHQMADFYTWIIKEYLTVIPQAQQWGICQWCATDAPADSGWRKGEPVGLWDIDFYRKHTYAGFAKGFGAE